MGQAEKLSIVAAQAWMLHDTVGNPLVSMIGVGGRSEMQAVSDWFFRDRDEVVRLTCRRDCEHDRLHTPQLPGITRSVWAPRCPYADCLTLILTLTLIVISGSSQPSTLSEKYAYTNFMPHRTSFVCAASSPTCSVVASSHCYTLRRTLA